MSNEIVTHDEDSGAREQTGGSVDSLIAPTTEQRVGHTPGPWSRHILTTATPGVVRSDRDGTWEYRDIYIGSGDKIVASALMWTARSGGWPRVDNVPESEANARLITAAPELLHALRECIAIVDAAGLIHLSDGVQLGQMSWLAKASDRFDFARTVIAKAEGK